MADGRYERQLINAFRECGYAALRAPSSGSATDANLPDILAAQATVTGHADALAIELKTTSGTTAYADGVEVEALREFADTFGATAYLGAKFKRAGGARSPFYLVEPEFCRQTDGGNYGVPEADAERRAAWVIYPPTANQPASVEGVAEA